MGRYRFQSYAKDGNGAIITDATVTVYLAGGTTAADVYTGETSGSSVTSVTSDSDTGNFYFWVDIDDYTGEQLFKTVVSKTAFGSTTNDDISILPHLYAGSGATTASPTVTTIGMYYVDTDKGGTVFWNGSAWTAFTLASDTAPELSGDLDLNENDIIYDTAGTKITAAELGYLDGTTSALQTQMDLKSPIANPTFTGEIGITNGTAGVNVSETEFGILEGATLSTTELNYVKDVTSSIQTQINAVSTDGAIKGWVNFDGTSTGAISTTNSLNVSGVVHNTTGDYTISWTTNFASSGYAVTCSGARHAGSGKLPAIGVHTKAAGSVRIEVEENGSTDNIDIADISVMAIGDQ